ncbi:odorant receptor 46a-like [Achroia grisella]|uniref:odorant receptor 46a-like n=1 Tax=Achroia grisella TaxID=688607 RepID=UPI0027D24BCA|nr:odorant receptor 46a-like [Achroia grisella]
MASEIDKRVLPFDSFYLVYKGLSWTGFLKPDKSQSRFKSFLNYVHQLLAFCMILLVNIGYSHFILTCNNKDAMFETIILLIPHMNVVFKYFTLLLQTTKLLKLNEVINGPYFCAKNEKDQKFLNENNKEMYRLTMFMYVSVALGGCVWILSYVMKRIQDEDNILVLYLPIDTKSWSRFIFAVVLETHLTLVVAYGHVSFDSVVAVYYAQAMVQLKILKYNIEHMFDAIDKENESFKYQALYRDIKNTALKERFVYYVKKYDQIVWFTRKVNSVFNIALSIQFVSMTGCCCFLIYVMSIVYRLSVPFIFILILIIMYQVQLFLYCYYGSLVEFESQSVCSSVYLSDWISVSPPFRNSLLIAMIRWTEPIETRVSVVVPLSLSTMITIIRSSYTLFAVLSETNEKCDDKDAIFETISLEIAQLNLLVKFLMAAFQSDKLSKLNNVVDAFLETHIILCLTYGHISYDSIIGLYYAQAMVQLKIMKYNVERLFDEFVKDNENTTRLQGKYIDINNAQLKENFIFYVKKYEEIIPNRFSIPFIYLMTLTSLFQVQLFLYCYYGSLVEYESQSVCTSLYMSNWLSVSPSFRRSLLIAMTRWTVPIETRVSVVVPLSLNTLITIIRSSYTLYTLLTETNDNA